jgi:chromosome segregation ATPase
MAAITAPVIDISEVRAKISGSLYEIVDHLDALFNSVELTEEGSPERAEVEAHIEAYLEAEIRKVDNVAGYLAHCEAQQAFAAEEVKRLQQRKQSWERKQERLESSIERVMQIAGKTKLEGRVNTLTLKACPPSVEVLDQKLVPSQYLRTTVTESVDKVIAKVDLKAGIAVPGLALVTDRKSVVRR